MINGYLPKFTLPSGVSDDRHGDGVAMIIDGTSMLIDGFEGGEPTNRMMTWLASKGVSDIDIAVLTHGHYDHYHGLELIERDKRFHIKTLYCYDPETLRHGVDNTSNGRAVKSDIANMYNFINYMKSQGTDVEYIDHDSKLKVGDINWNIYRKQPKTFGHLDGGEGYAFLNDGSLVLYSPEVRCIFGGDGPGALKDAIAYFNGDVIFYDVSHHGNSCPQSDAHALKLAGCILAWQSCIDVVIDNCDFTAGLYSRHDIYVSIDQRKSQNIICKNINVNNCRFDHSGLELDANNHYYSPNTVAVNVRASINVVVENSYFTDVTGAVAWFSQEGAIDGGVLRNSVVNSPVYNSGTAETRQIVNCVSSNYPKDVTVDSVFVLNVPNDYATFASLTSCNIRIINCNIGRTRILVNESVNIFADNITTTIPYYFCRFNYTATGFISHIYFAATLTGNKYYYADGISTQGLIIDDGSVASITVTPNTEYIGSLTSNSYKRGRVGVISFYFKCTTQMPVGTVIATIDENVIARIDGIAFNASAFGGAVYAKNGNIVTNSVINTSVNFYFITIPVILS